MKMTHRQSNGSHALVFELVEAFRASSDALDEAIETNDAARITQIDSHLSSLWHELVAYEPGTKAEARELLAFLLCELAPNAGSSSVQSEAVSGILRLFDMHGDNFRG